MCEASQQKVPYVDWAYFEIWGKYQENNDKNTIIFFIFSKVAVQFI